jgi:broad specificity phosphatase PhoE
MLVVHLIRHGQASFGQNNYDKLSTLGEQQCELLGRFCSEKNCVADLSLCGPMVRHRETMELVHKQMPPGSCGQIEFEELLREANMHKIVKRYAPSNTSITLASSGDNVRAFMAQVLSDWRKDENGEGMSSFREFHTRIRNLETLLRGKVGTVVLFTSYMVIVELLCVMGFADATNTLFRNGSISTVSIDAGEKDGAWRLVCMDSVEHFKVDGKLNEQFITFV